MNRKFRPEIVLSAVTLVAIGAAIGLTLEVRGLLQQEPQPTSINVEFRGGYLTFENRNRNALVVTAPSGAEYWIEPGMARALGLDLF